MCILLIETLLELGPLKPISYPPGLCLELIFSLFFLFFSLGVTFP